MAAFDDLDWRRFDVWTLVADRGIGLIEPANASACHSWLERQGYFVWPWYFDAGISPAVAEIGKFLHWEDRFGYALKPESRNLDAFRDGFLWDGWPSEAVLEVHGAEVAWREEPYWFMSVLSIAQEHSLWQLALGRRFLTVLILDKSSPLVGQEIEVIYVPGPYSSHPPDKMFND